MNKLKYILLYLVILLIFGCRSKKELLGNEKVISYKNFDASKISTDTNIKGLTSIYIEYPEHEHNYISVGCFNLNGIPYKECWFSCIVCDNSKSVTIEK